MNPTCSVVIPAYNAAATLARCVASVRAQSVPVTEIIVVNDGSTDDTAAVLSRLGDDLRVLHTPNRGAAAARNSGVHAATSEWIAFHDADDEWLPEKMAQQWELQARYKQAVLLYTQAVNINAQGEPGLVWPEQVSTSANDAALLPHWACLAEYPPTPSVLVRRNLLLEAGLFPEGLATAEDLDLWVRLRVFGPFVGLARPLVRRHLSGTSLTAVHSQVAQYERFFRVLRQRRSEIQAWLGQERVDGEAYLHACLANVYLRSGERRRQLFHAFRALWGRHPHRGLAARLFAEALVGPSVYGACASLARAVRPPLAARPTVS